MNNWCILLIVLLVLSIIGCIVVVALWPITLPIFLNEENSDDARGYQFLVIFPWILVVVFSILLAICKRRFRD